MTTQADEARNGGLRGAVRKVAGHVSAIGRLEAELARSELKRKTRSLGIGLALGLGAALCGLLMVAFLFATLTAVLALFLATWLALLVMTLFFGVVAGGLGLAAMKLVKKGTPPLPEQAIREAKLTGEVFKR